MADPNALYSYQGREPELLSHEIFYTESWGAVNYRQGVESFTNEELTKAGYSGPYTKPTYDETTHFLAWNSEELNWEVKEIVKKPDFVDEYQFKNAVGEQIKFLLRETDWTQLMDSPLDDDTRKKFADYRQEVRDITEVITPNIEDYMNDASTIPWPKLPTKY